LHTYSHTYRSQGGRTAVKRQAARKRKTGRRHRHVNSSSKSFINILNFVDNLKMELEYGIGIGIFSTLG